LFCAAPNPPVAGQPIAEHGRFFRIKPWPMSSALIPFEVPGRDRLWPLAAPGDNTQPARSKRNSELPAMRGSDSYAGLSPRLDELDTSRLKSLGPEHGVTTSAYFHFRGNQGVEECTAACSQYAGLSRLRASVAGHFWNREWRFARFNAQTNRSVQRCGSACGPILR